MNRLREIRKSRGLTMKQLGKMVNVTEAAIGYYETGKRSMNYEMLLKLGEALDCSVADIVEDKKIPATESDGQLGDLELAVSHASDRQRELIKRILGYSDSQVDAFLSITQSPPAKK